MIHGRHAVLVWICIIDFSVNTVILAIFLRTCASLHIVTLSVALAISVLTATVIAIVLDRRLIAAHALADTQLVANIREENLALTNEALTDALTGIANRRHFDRALEYETHRAIREAADLAFLLIDVDKFKDYNDYYGHASGDECLKLVAFALRETVRRAEDLVARYGGEEFGVILPNTNAEGALLFAERLRAAVETMAIEHRPTTLGFVTISIGVAALSSDRYLMPHDYIVAADSALYRAKDAGRNCVKITRD